MTHTPIDVTPEQHQNLQTLADYLLRPKPTAMRFDMGVFVAISSSVAVHDPRDHECGTVGCAAGHGPAAGISPRSSRSWDDYTERSFGASPYHSSSHPGVWLWDWCFCGTWSLVDNTPTGAARRILIALEKGIPDTHIAQQQGVIPLEYEP